jgi:hypothetical protein
VPEKRLRFYEAKKKWREIDLPDAVIVCLQKYWNMLDKKEQSREYLFDFVGRTAYTHFNNWCRPGTVILRVLIILRVMYPPGTDYPPVLVYLFCTVISPVLVHVS